MSSPIINLFWSLFVNKGLQYFSLISVYILISVFADESGLGIFDYFTTLIALCVNITLLGQDSAIGRFIVNVSSAIERGHILLCSFALQLGNFLLFIAIPILILKYLKNSLLQSAFSVYSVSLLFFGVTSGLLIDNILNVLRWSLRSLSFSLMSAVIYILPLFSVLISIFCGNSKIISILSAFVFGRLVSAVFSLLFLRNSVSIRTFRLVPLFRLTCQLFRYGFPIGLASAVIVVIPFFEKSLIISSLGFSSLSQYAFASKFILILDIFSSLFVGSWLPYIHLKNPRREQLRLSFNKALETFLFFCLHIYVLVVFLGIFLSHSNFVNLYRYASSVQLLAPLGFAAIVNGASCILTAEFSINKNSITQFLSLSIFGFGYCMLLYYGMSSLGLVAVGYAAAIASVIRFIFVFFKTSTYRSSDIVGHEFFKLVFFVLPFLPMLEIANMLIDTGRCGMGIITICFSFVFVSISFKFLYGKIYPLAILSSIFGFNAPTAAPK